MLIGPARAERRPASRASATLVTVALGAEDGGLLATGQQGSREPGPSRARAPRSSNSRARTNGNRSSSGGRACHTGELGVKEMRNRATLYALTVFFAGAVFLLSSCADPAEPVDPFDGTLDVLDNECDENANAFYLKVDGAWRFRPCDGCETISVVGALGWKHRRGTGDCGGSGRIECGSTESGGSNVSASAAYG